MNNDGDSLTAFESLANSDCILLICTWIVVHNMKACWPNISNRMEHVNQCLLQDANPANHPNQLITFRPSISTIMQNREPKRNETTQTQPQGNRTESERPKKRTEINAVDDEHSITGY